jgi:hypothetical protein
MTNDATLEAQINPKQVLTSDSNVRTISIKKTTSVSYQIL